MPALIATEDVGRITWLDCVSGSAANPRSVPVQKISLILDGMPGDCHKGRARPACSRGRAIANTRQLSIVSVEELKQIAEKMGLGGA